MNGLSIIGEAGLEVRFQVQTVSKFYVFLSLSFTYGTDKTKDHGILVESYGTRGLQEGEKIIGVYGNHGGFLDKVGTETSVKTQHEHRYISFVYTRINSI